MVPRHRERIPGDDAGRPEQHVPGELVICLVLRRKIPADPIVHHADILNSPVPIRRIRPAVCQVDAPRERYDIRDQTFDFHSLIPKVQSKGMFLSARRAQHGVFAGDHNAADCQRVWGYGLQNLATPDDVAQPPASPSAFPDATLVFLLGKAASRLEIGGLLSFEVKELACFTCARHSTFDQFGHQPAGRVLRARQDR